ncbi:MAG: aspartate/glutamate racemase family protein [Roseibium sp.]|nr:aspartate/glutamate racemase family protein [Roseibium sp.]
MKLDFEVDDGSATAAAIGLIVLQADETIEIEFRTVFDQPGVALYHSRIPSAPEVTPESLETMRVELPCAAALLPRIRPLSAVAYGCTSGATIIGPSDVADLIKSHHPKAKVTDPLTAALAAFTHLDLRKIGFVTPYIRSVSDAIENRLTQNGVTIARHASFEQSEEQIVARISPASVESAICSVGANSEIEAVFASCTNLRTFDVIETCEARLGKPVLSSNLVLAWHTMLLAGLSTAGAGPGQLFAR